MTNSKLDQNINAVVRVNTARGSGSGFYSVGHGVIVTNFHVIAGFKEVAVEDKDKNRHHCRVVMVNPELDIAILAPLSPLAHTVEISFNPAGEIKGRDKVIVAGFPFGMPLSVTEGVVSAARQVLNNREYIQTDAAINPGNSGGPMFNEAGEVVGMTTCKFNHAENMGFALPIKHVVEVLQALDEGKKQGFHVQCSSCDTYESKPVENCSNCGDKFDVSAFDDYKLNDLEKFVEGALKSVDLNPVLGRKGSEYWEIYSGSALTRIFVYGQSYLYATSPLAVLPKQKLEEVFRYLLAFKEAPYYLGLKDKTIFLSYRVHLSDLHNVKHQKVLQDNLSQFFKRADELDNILVSQFGCEPSQESILTKNAA